MQRLLSSCSKIKLNKVKLKTYQFFAFLITNMIWLIGA